ncbi:glycosyltransferase family 1 protein [Flavobacterium bomense]|uniref:Glycosyltransferase family 1 protein n=1 Tax=Flavobacterium bomense TaxID=2497483 RepID=A0A432CGG0_9FLAO|nr:glycosyltransferase family 1 protein [Flavobacterium bomense]RTZ02052.1 glycosyltransferase family 1 protein [Flavobacterium bomense]
MKINVNLQSLNNWGTGICLFGNKLIEHFNHNTNYELYGCFNFVRGVKSNNLNRFRFPVKYSIIPSKLVYSRVINSYLPFYYHNMMGNKGDINLFFTYKIPRVRYKGITICTIHDLIPLKVSQENRQIEIDYRNDITYAINHSNYLITVSEASKKDIISEFNYPENKITVIPNGVDFNFFNKALDETELSRIRAKYKLPKKFILYFGNIRKHKNVDSLIRAYSLLSKEVRNEVSLVITQGNEELFQLVKELNLENQVCFTTFIDDADLPCIYKLALVMVFISLYEGFGLPIIEAMAAGTPVITSNISSMPEIAGKAAILVSPLQLKEISEALEKVIQNPEIRIKMIGLGYENAKKYSWKHSGEKLAALCAELLN